MIWRRTTIVTALAALTLAVTGRHELEEPGLQPFEDLRLHEIRDPGMREAALYAHSTLELLKSRDFQGLEARAAETLAQRGRFSNGQWKLEAFYGAFTTNVGRDDAARAERVSALQDWVSAKPQSVTAHVALGQTIASFAWEALENRALRPADSADLAIQLETALRVLEDARPAGIRDPHYWRVAHAIAIGLGWPEGRLREIAQECAALEPEYWPMDIARACFLLAKTGSGPGDLAEFAAQRANSAPNGDEVYARIAWELRDVSGNVFTETGLDWERVKAGYRSLLRRYPDSPELTTQYCLLACQARDRSVARRCFVRLGGNVDPRAFATHREFMRHLRWANWKP